ncbi:virulence factor MviM [Candidatus Symbiopectobacterium sp. 'North America']|uniref:Gfo/Idh/MocA family protein n=1 Tax=Candidatus Symbiopectobacterium sp. 'North America' TaxID=2794574 RepID=UPI0018CA09B6|nr:Gfo/Idh/MocA family oxidoreductase [Candidatus Symbiopectobacterium sp. 'North America']MBG6244950.1 virulence factor MviM [Candidatus Symbiopectobacterium sp. 'North America']
MNTAKTDAGRIRIGIVGLGSIAQKAYIPVLSQETHWTFAGVFSPDQQKMRTLCQQYRLSGYSSLQAMASVCDAVMVHSSTASHYDVISTLLHLGVHVCVDKPLAETLPQAEALLALADRQGKTVMVGFNRRFAPGYRSLKSTLLHPDSVRVEKYCADNVGPQPARFTLLDDYLHVVDTALWLAGEGAALLGGVIRNNAAGQLVFAEHLFASSTCQVVTSMHRCAGSQRESVQMIGQGAIHHVDNLSDCWLESGGIITRSPAPSWQSILEQRGFVGAVHHFVDSLEKGVQPQTSGEQAILAQRVVESLLTSC